MLLHIYRDVSLSSITASLLPTHTLVSHWEVDEAVSWESVSKEAIRVTFLSQNSSFGLRTTKGNTRPFLDAGHTVLSTTSFRYSEVSES